MHKMSCRVSLLVIILMLPWTVIYAAGLGKLKLNSALGQPLNAEIDIVTTNSDEVSSLKANIASREAFAQAGIHYEPNFPTFKTSIELRTNGNPYIKLASPQAINDPFLNILVELNWDSGLILREYAVLLDPIEMNAQNQNIAAPAVSPVPITNAVSRNTERTFDLKENRQGEKSTRSINRSNQAKDTYGPVIRGDTLSSIARRVLPTGVDLNQMLVALYRANREAFIANNMNLLKVGAILKIPEQSEIAAIDVPTASNEIRMQVEDWHRYHSKVTSISSESSVAHIRQSDQGKITTSINKNSVSARESPKEVLRLSSGARLTTKGDQISEPALADRLRMMEEDAIARNLALKEANERVAMLEKGIENLKQLLELKDSVLAQAQIKAGSDPRIETKSEAHLIETINSLSSNESKPDMNFLQTQEQKALIAQSATEGVIKDVATKSLPPQETENRSLIDQISSNIEYIGAASVLILLTLLLILKKQRNQSKEEAELDENDSDFSSAMQTRMASMVAAQTMPVTETNHLFSENEKDDLTHKNINSYFEQNFEENRNQLIDFKKDTDSSDSVSRINFDLTNDTNETKQNLTSEQFLVVDQNVKDKIELSDNPVNLQKTTNVLGYELEVPDNSEHSVSSADSEEIMAEKDNSIEFELTDSNINLAEREFSNRTKIPKISTESKSVDNFGVPELADEEAWRFDQQQGPANDTIKSESISMDMPELGLRDINLNIEHSDSVEERDEASGLNDKSEQWQEVETKLDLAKAYQEMDDKESAKEMLEEVIRNGDAKQKKVATKLLKSLQE